MRRFFGGVGSTWIDRLALPFLWVVSVAVLILALPFVLTFLVIYKVRRPYLPDVRKTAASLDLSDRLLFVHAVKATRFVWSSNLRVHVGAYVHPLLIATDRRLALAEPFSELPVPADHQQFSIAWDIPYLRIRSVSSKTVNGAANEIVTIETSERTITYKLPSAESEALIAIVRRRAPEAFGESSPSRRAGEIAA